MMAETREKLEKGNEDIVQALEKYLRSEASSESLQNDSIMQALRKRLCLKAKDYAFKHNLELDDTAANNVANEALQRYQHNWQNKEQGIDNRGHRFGISW